MSLGRWLLAGFVLLVAKVRRRPRLERERIVPEGAPSPGSELLVLLLLLLATLCAAAFPVVYAVSAIPHQTQFLGLSLGLALLLLAAALIVAGRALVVDEQLEEEYPPPVHASAVEELEQLVEESGSRFTRKRLLIAGAGAAGTALSVAIVTPVLSLGPFFDTDPFYETPWRRGRRLVDDEGRPLRAEEVARATFYTAYPEGADKENIGSPLVVVRLEPRQLRLPEGRGDWAPDGILAYSKVCTHAGCAINLYRTPTFAPAQPRPALICPCHYSTFDPAAGAKVIFGPAGRPLPQLPLMVDSAGVLRSAGNFSGPVGPAWWGVHLRGAD